MVSDETNAAAEHEQTVQSTNLKERQSAVIASEVDIALYLDVLIRFLGSESTTIAQQIHEANRDATINVEDELFKTDRSEKDSNYFTKNLTVSFFEVVTFSTARA
jgi:hypothetical protein